MVVQFHWNERSAEELSGSKVADASRVRLEDTYTLRSLPPYTLTAREEARMDTETGEEEDVRTSEESAS